MLQIPAGIAEFRHEIVSAVLVSMFMGVAMWPFKKAVKAYAEVRATLDAVHSELLTQRTNHLSHIEASGEEQVKLLGKTVDVLTEMRVDNREILTHLRDKF